MNKPNRSKYIPQSKSPITPASQASSSRRCTVADLRAVFAKANIPLHCSDTVLAQLAKELNPALLQRMSSVGRAELEALAEGLAKSEETRGTRISPEPVPNEFEPSNTGADPLLAAISRIGQPIEYTVELFTVICRRIAAGYTTGAACAKGSIPESALNEWRRLEPGLDSVLEIARELHRAAQLEVIMKAASGGNWRASIAFLKLSFPGDYGTASQRKAALKAKETNTAPTTPPIKRSEAPNRAGHPSDAPTTTTPPSDATVQNTLAKGNALDEARYAAELAASLRMPAPARDFAEQYHGRH